MKWKLEAKHVLGVLVATVVAWFINIETTFLTGYFSSIGNSSVGSLGHSIYLGKILAIIAFSAIVFAFFRYVRNSLGSYLILSVVVSIMAVLLVIFGTGFLAVHTTIQEKMNELLQEKTALLLSSLATCYGIVLIAVFVVTFQIMVKRKVKYLEYITGQVTKMEQEGFGTVIQVKGHDELSTLSQGISKMSVTLKEKQDKEKSEEDKKLQLIADLSHDIRTPLTSVIGYTELLRENEFAEPKKCKEYIEVIDRRLSDMKTMVEQLFDYTRLNQVDYVLTKEKTDLLPLLHYIDSEYSRIFRNNGLLWNLQAEGKELQAELDSEKFMRAMANLLDNAKKYGKKGEEVKMVVKRLKDQIVISISNGIEDDGKLDVCRMFDRFYKSDKARTGTTSTGLGLPIVKKIVELHDGTIDANIVENRLVFTIYLPT